LRKNSEENKMKTREKIEEECKRMISICPDKIELIYGLFSLEMLLDIRELLQSLSEKARKE